MSIPRNDRNGLLRNFPAMIRMRASAAQRPTFAVGAESYKITVAYANLVDPGGADFRHGNPHPFLILASVGSHWVQ